MERRPDYQNVAFWTWAISACSASPTVLCHWFPEVTRHAWAYRREEAIRVHRIQLPELKKGRHVDAPADPPAGWPERAPEEPKPSEPERQYKESTEILPDGSRKSDRLLAMNEEQAKSPEYLLTAHGFDPAEWELVSAKNNIWQVFSKNPAAVAVVGDGRDALAPGQPPHVISTLYSSRITVKPTAGRWSLDDLLAAFRESCTPFVIESPTFGIDAAGLLELGYTDPHFGNSTIETYRSTVARSVEIIRSRTWKRIVIWTGSDFFHCDNFQNTTVHGTLQSSVWWPDAFADGLEFIGTIIEAALGSGAEVYVVYVPGNHDESMSWMFAKLLEQRYPDAVHDTEIAERKIHVYGECAIGLTHGDEKTRKDLDRVFAAEFREFSAALHKEVHMGHLHHEATKDNYGVVSRSLPTGARTDKWHRTEGFVGARKRFQVFEWDANEGVTDIHYV